MGVDYMGVDLMGMNQDRKVEVMFEKLTMHSNSLGPTFSVPGVHYLLKPLWTCWGGWC